MTRIEIIIEKTEGKGATLIGLPISVPCPEPGCGGEILTHPRFEGRCSECGTQHELVEVEA